MQLRSSFAALADLVLPRACLGCGRAGTSWCAACRPRGAPLVVAAGGLSVHAAGPYDGALRTALIGYKERGRVELVAALGGLLAHAAGAASAVSPATGGGGLRVVLVPVPSSAAAARARGGDHLARLARTASRTCGLPVVNALHLGRAVADSAGLTRPERAANLRGAMWARPAGSGLRVVVLDDILTSGATVREARRALSAAGWPVCGAAVIAATPRHTPLIDAPGTASRGGLPWG